MGPAKLALFALLCLLGLGACVLFGPTGIGLPSPDSSMGRAILLLRANRVLCGFIVGAALAAAGVVFQAVLQNPLAEPYVLGVSGGAGLGAALAILTGLGALGPLSLPVCAFVGGAATLLLVFNLARDGQGTPNIYSLILCGVVVSAVCSSLLMFLVATAPVEGLHSVLWWMLGDLQPGSTGLLLAIGASMLAGLGIVWSLTPELNALALGREAAHHVGVRLNIAVPLALGAATFLAAAAVSLSGLIGFVGLIVPHAARGLAGADHRRLLPVSALLGGTSLAVCDALARTVMAPVEVPVGVITALCGGPFFLYLLRRKRKGGWAP
jgi:iron complex transport system permease protein